ncbi:unnamed protein product [Closterium sp. NIES-53]
MYLMTCTRPDLAYPLSILARYVAPGRHRPEHMAAAKRVLRYLCSTSGLGLVLGGLGSGSVSWRSTRSSSVLGSSCEAEIYAGAMAAQELRWLTYLLTDLGEPPRSPPVLYVDNKAMLALCWEHRLEHRTKHIALRYFLARELQQHGQLHLAYVASEANTADIFTKALPPGDHQRFCTMLACFALLCLTGLVTSCSPPLCLWGQEAAGKWGSGTDADAAAAAADAAAAAAGPDHQCHYRPLLPHRRCCPLHRSQCLRRPHHHLHRLHPHDQDQRRGYTPPEPAGTAPGLPAAAPAPVAPPAPAAPAPVPSDGPAPAEPPAPTPPATPTPVAPVAPGPVEPAAPVPPEAPAKPPVGLTPAASVVPPGPAAPAPPGQAPPEPVVAGVPPAPAARLQRRANHSRSSCGERTSRHDETPREATRADPAPPGSAPPGSEPPVAAPPGSAPQGSTPPDAAPPGSAPPVPAPPGSAPSVSAPPEPAPPDPAPAGSVPVAAPESIATSTGSTASSCEAEIYAGAMAAQELRWLTYLLTDLGEQPRSPPVLYVDNKAMLALCREHKLVHRTKHIALRYFLARELQQRGQLRLAYVASEANTADIFTKALAPGDHQRFCTLLGLVFLLVPNILLVHSFLFLYTHSLSCGAGNIKKPPPEVVLKWISRAWKAVPAYLIKKSFLTCGISNALDGSEDHLVMAHRRSQLSHEVEVDDDIQADGFWGNNSTEPESDVEEVEA